MKPCVKCGAVERNKRGDCMPCDRARCKQYRLNNKEKTRETWRKWEANNLEKVVLSNRKKVATSIRKHPDKYRARQKVQYAIRSGKLPRAKECICFDCNNQASHYHHEDYLKPLEVIPLCNSCHRKRHA